MMQSINSRNIINAAVAAFFVATIAIPFSGLWRPHDGSVEKRTLAAMPSLPTSFRQAAAYPAKMESFVNDNFGLRDRFLTLHADISRTVFGTSGSPRVILGSGGWLFYTGDGSLADMQRQAAPTQASLGNWKASLTDRARWLSERGITYRFVTAPDKHSLFPEKIPSRYQWDGESRYTQIRQHVGTSAPLVDLLPDLVRKKSNGAARLYFESDTHWTGFGAYVGYRTIMQSLGEAYRGATLQFADEEFGDDGIPRARDLAIMSRNPRMETEKVATGFQPCGHSVDVQPPSGVDVSRILRFAGHECPSRAKTLLIFHDSFGSAISPYFNSTFGRVVSIWGTPNDELFVRMVLQEKPDVVIEERVERFMGVVPEPTMATALRQMESVTLGKVGQ